MVLMTQEERDEFEKRAIDEEDVGALLTLLLVDGFEESNNVDAKTVGHVDDAEPQLLTEK